MINYWMFISNSDEQNYSYVTNKKILDTPGFTIYEATNERTCLFKALGKSFVYNQNPLPPRVL